VTEHEPVEMQLGVIETIAVMFQRLGALAAFIIGSVILSAAVFGVTSKGAVQLAAAALGGVLMFAGLVIGVFAERMLGIKLKGGGAQVETTLAPRTE
jgi:hypothetical protein